MRDDDLSLLRSEWFPRSFIEEEDCRQTLKVWLSDGNYYANNSPPNLSLQCLDIEEFKRGISLDAFRFSAHAAQTICEVEKTSAYKKLTSWRVIQVYYAAFFAAHALLRFFGSSFSYLETGHVADLKRKCLNQAGYTPSLKSSNYLIDFDPQARSVDFVSYDESHKDLWKCFARLISRLERASLTFRASNQRQQELSAYFADLGDALTDGGRLSSGNWLSYIRNEVNYKSAPDVWFPFSKNTPSFEELSRSVRGWQFGNLQIESPNLVRNEFERFFMTAFAVVDFCMAVSLDYKAFTSNAGKRSASFLKVVNLGAAA